MATNKLKKKIGKGRHASTIKRAKQNIKLRARNKQAMSRLKTVVKKVRTTKKVEDLKLAVPIIAKTAQKGIIPRRRAERLISRLTRAVQAV